jgi:PAS domain S-box-containing protein
MSLVIACNPAASQDRPAPAPHASEARESRDRTTELSRLNEALAQENTEQQRMEAILRMREERYRLLVEASGIIPWEIDLHSGHLTYIGPQAVNVFGYPIEAWYEKDFWLDHLQPEDRERAIEFYASQTVFDKRHEFEYRFYTADGRTIWVRDIVNPVSNPDTEARTLMGVMVDITRQKELEAALKADKEAQEKLVAQLKEAQNQLIQSEKMASIGQLAAGVAHEINNPVGFVNSNMNTLTGYVRDLLDMVSAYEQMEALVSDQERIAGVRELKARVDLDYLREDIFHLLSESQEGLTRVKKIVQDLKEFSHVGKTEMQWADLHRGLDSTLNIAHNEIKYKADVVKEYGELPQVECVPSQLNQVFMNLLVNAAHAIDKRGVITVRTGVKDGWVWTEVADTGAGIPPENLSKLFDPFFTTKPVGKGTGLGLSLSYGIVRKHGGRIEVESEVGRGSTFRVRLPVSQSAKR